MDEKFQKQITFHLTGRRDCSNLAPKTANYRPALFARYSDLTSLRYDFPLILNREGSSERALLSLSNLVDEVIERLTEDPERDRTARHAYEIEREIRRELGRSGSGEFATIWKLAVSRLAEDDIEVENSAERLWTSFFASGDVVDVDVDLPTRAVRHLWNVIQENKARKFREEAERLLYRLHNILEVESQGSDAGRSPERLKAGVGAAFAGTFDFNVMSRTIAESLPPVQLSKKRRQRIENLIDILERQRFYPLGTSAPESYDFVFTRCSEALNSYQGRYEDAIELVNAVAIAELETKGEYREAIHDGIFEGFRGAGLAAERAAMLPEYLVAMNGSAIDAREWAEIAEMLSAGLPIKILIVWDDILESRPLVEGNIGLASTPRQLTSAAIALTDVYVFQADASRLFKLRDALVRGLSFDGPALFSVFSGANSNMNGISPYLVAAAAAESRVFPAFVYDPSAGPDRSTRFAVDENPFVDSDWPSYTFDYEDDNLQTHSEQLSFTFADFLAMDDRFAEHLAIVPSDDWNPSMVSISDALNTRTDDLPASVPAITLVDDEFRLSRAIVDARVLDATRRCLSWWHSIRELGGVNNSNVERQTLKVSKPPVDVPESRVDESEFVAERSISEPPIDPENATDTEPGVPYIETARCTTCNECTQINNKMFAYNADKQAYIADADAGTFRQLVEAAEGCQVSIIHPGKPRNLKEPGLDELVKRAAEFN